MQKRKSESQQPDDAALIAVMKRLKAIVRKVKRMRHRESVGNNIRDGVRIAAPGLHRQAGVLYELSQGGFASIELGVFVFLALLGVLSGKDSVEHYIQPADLDLGLGSRNVQGLIVGLLGWVASLGFVVWDISRHGNVRRAAIVGALGCAALVAGEVWLWL